VIISRTPLRMSFVGGGSDLPAFYREEPGAVLSTAIDKFVYVSVNPKFGGGIRLAYSQTEEVERLEQIQHRLFRATFETLGIEGGVEVTTTADIPSRGTGLGSSSTFTVGLLKVMSAYGGRDLSADLLAKLACEVEIDRCGEPIGKQDQYAAAFGGMNLFEFMPDETVRVSPVVMSAQVRARMEAELLVFYTGKTRSASSILVAQSQAVIDSTDARRALRRMVELAYQMCDDLSEGRTDAIGPILNEGWSLKKTLAHGISDPDIDCWYDAGMKAGASGGKLLGAGAGGFLVFFAPVDRHEAIARAVQLPRMKVGFSAEGAKIVYYNPSDGSLI